MIGKWLERDPRRGWCLKQPEPKTVDELLEAIREATELGGAGQGAGAPVFDHAKRLREYLQTLLDVELSKRAGDRQIQIFDIAGEEIHPMDDREQIQQDRRNRFRFLKYLYDENRKLDSRYIQSISAQEVGEAIGVSSDEGVKIGSFLQSKRLIDYQAMGPKVGISHYGIEYVEEALANPDRPTEFFPPLNVLMIQGGVHGSQIQQGTDRSSQQQEIRATNGPH